MREFPSPLRPLKLLVMEYQPLLLRRFHSAGDKTSNPLERLSTREPQAPLRQVRCKQSSTPNARRAVNYNMVPSLSVGNGVLDCLFLVILMRQPSEKLTKYARSDTKRNYPLFCPILLPPSRQGPFPGTMTAIEYEVGGKY